MEAVALNFLTGPYGMKILHVVRVNMEHIYSEAFGSIDQTKSWLQLMPNTFMVPHSAGNTRTCSETCWDVPACLWASTWSLWWSEADEWSMSVFPQKPEETLTQVSTGLFTGLFQSQAQISLHYISLKKLLVFSHIHIFLKNVLSIYSTGVQI